MLSFVILFTAVLICYPVEASYDCDVKLEAVGCFKDHRDDRALPTQLINERDTTSKVYDGILIQWKNPDYLPQFLCRCAKKAKSNGYMYFGLQFYGECWSGHKSHITYSRHGKSSKCKKHSSSSSTCHIEYGMNNANYVYKIIDRQCGTDYSPVGCFTDNMISPRPLPNYALNERDRSINNWSGRMIDWQNWRTWLPQFVCRCAQLAKDLGDDIFAIQYYGECWTAKRGLANYKRDGTSDKCVGRNFTSCKCYDYHCAGMQKANFVYQLHGVGVKHDTKESNMVDFHHYDYPEYEKNAYFYKNEK